MRRQGYLQTVIAAIACWGLTARPAAADQCAYVSKAQALLAASRLNVGQILYELCEPCGEVLPKATKINSISVGTVDNGDYWEVSVNGRGIDLAYSYIDSGIEGKPIALSAIAGCPATKISPFLPNVR